jgi:acetyltransferase-like isoleucine patch superfamily enzyme
MKKIIINLLTKIYKYRVAKRCRKFSEPLKVNKFSTVTNNTILGKNCNINGITIKGDGSVNIGENFHSGENCLLITSFHKYDGGNAIPYDCCEDIHREIIIEDNVWLGDKVIILGG